jgi:2-dehydropantoate 2-reductase
LNRVAPGVIRHSAHGWIVLGEHGRRPGDRTQRLAEALEQAGIRVRVTEDLARAHWEKLVWNVPFNGLGVAGVAGIDALQPGASLPKDLRPFTLPTDALLGDLPWERIVRELMLEVIAAANALGHGIATATAEEQIERTRVMGAYKASTLLDFETGRALELQHLFLEPRRRAQLAGVATPRLDALCQVLEALEERRARQTGPE